MYQIKYVILSSRQPLLLKQQAESPLVHSCLAVQRNWGHLYVLEKRKL